MSDYTNDGVVVLVFYPFDFNPVCTEVLCAFRDAEWLIFTEAVDVFGVTCDSCYAHKAFITEHDSLLRLLSDTAGRVTEQFGLAYGEWEQHKDVPKRALVTIDSNHQIRY